LHFEFFTGAEPRVANPDRVTWENFFRFCAEEMDDLSKLTCGMPFPIAFQLSEQLKSRIKRPATRAKSRRLCSPDTKRPTKTQLLNFDGRCGILWSEAVTVVSRNLEE
jgi:hypothetical protein